MKAIRLHARGGPEALRFEDAPVPRPGPGEVPVRVRAAAVTPTELLWAPRPQRDVAGRHYLTKAEINALYFATYQMQRPRGWDLPIPVGRYWRAALVLF